MKYFPIWFCFTLNALGNHYLSTFYVIEDLFCDDCIGSKYCLLGSLHTNFSP